VEAAGSAALGRDPLSDARWAPGAAPLAPLLAQALAAEGAVGGGGGGASLATAAWAPLLGAPSYAAVIVPSSAGLHVLSAFHAARALFPSMTLDAARGCAVYLGVMAAQKGALAPAVKHVLSGAGVAPAKRGVVPPVGSEVEDWVWDACEGWLREWR
jgi:hypothetical protein